MEIPLDLVRRRNEITTNLLTSTEEAEKLKCIYKVPWVCKKSVIKAKNFKRVSILSYGHTDTYMYKILTHEIHDTELSEDTIKLKYLQKY